MHFPKQAGALLLLAGVSSQAKATAMSPTYWPTFSPPTYSPTYSPTTKSPTKSPTMSPTNSPTNSPTKSPTNSPTNSPTPAAAISSWALEFDSLSSDFDKDSVSEVTMNYKIGAG
eukprot:scaffold20197_cov61-Skeletonema_dohrnii-CCMP3373.AAC.1